jgi:hypothetical protein
VASIIFNLLTMVEAKARAAASAEKTEEILSRETFM